MSAHRTVWPAYPSRPAPRAQLIAAMVLVSLSGLLAGLALRPLTHGLLLSSPPRTVATPPQATRTPTPTAVAIATTPQAFYLGLTVTPRTVSSGGTISVRAQANLTDGPGSAQGVLCSLSITGPASLPAEPTMRTDASGVAEWTVTIPPATPPGAYVVAVTATWGEFRANWQDGLTVG